MATFTSIRGGHLIPALGPRFQGLPGFTTAGTLADSNDKAQYIFRIPKTGNTKAIGFRIAALTTPQDLRIAFQNVSATTGDADGVDDQSVVIPSASLVAGWNTTGTITRAVTRGDLVAVVITADSGTPSIAIGVAQYDNSGEFLEFPYNGFFTTAWAKSSRCSCLSLQYDDNTYEPIDGYVYPYTAFNSPTFGSGSTPDECGLKFQLPYTCKVDGGWMRSGITGDADVVLYDSNGTDVLTSVSLDKDQDDTAGPHYFTFSSEVTLTAATYYRLTLKPTTATVVTLRDFEVAAAALFDMFDLGQLAHYTERTDAGAWTDTTTKRPWMGVRVSAIQTDPGSSGPIAVAAHSPHIAFPRGVAGY